MTVSETEPKESLTRAGGYIPPDALSPIKPPESILDAVGDVKPLFPEVTQIRLCTANVCVDGHEWVPKIALARCGYGTPQGWNGCGSPVLAVKMENCPTCNQPVKYLRLRTDHTPPTNFPIPICIPNSWSPADIAQIQINRNYEAAQSENEKKAAMDDERRRQAQEQVAQIKENQ